MTTLNKLLSLIRSSSGDTSGVSCCIMCNQPYKLLSSKNTCIICNITACETCCKFHCHIEKLSYGKVCDDCVCNIIVDDENVSIMNSAFISSTASWKASDFLPSASYAISTIVDPIQLLFPAGLAHHLSNETRCYYFTISSGTKVLIRSPVAMMTSCHVVSWDEPMHIRLDIRNPWSYYLVFDFYSSISPSSSSSMMTSDWHEKYRIPIHDLLPRYSHIISSSRHHLQVSYNINSKYKQYGPVMMMFDAMIDDHHDHHVDYRVDGNDDVDEYKPCIFDVIIPGAISWHYIEPMLSNYHMLPLSLLYPTASASFSYLYDHKHKPSSSYLFPTSSSSLSSAAASYDENLLINLKLANTMSNSAFSCDHHVSSSTSSSSSSNWLEANLSMQVVPSHEMILHAILCAKLVISYNINNFMHSIIPSSSMISKYGVLLLTTHRLLFIRHHLHHHDHVDHHVDCHNDMISDAAADITSISLYQIRSVDTMHQVKHKDCVSNMLQVTHQLDNIIYSFMPVKQQQQHPHHHLHHAAKENKSSACRIMYDDIMAFRSIRYMSDEIIWRKEEDQFSTSSTTIATSNHKRLGIGSMNPHWRISSINASYDLCPSYPRYLVIPSDINDTTLAVAARTGRSRSRLPALTWLNPSGAALCRCSQPLGGVIDNPNLDDEALLLAIRSSVMMMRSSAAASSSGDDNVWKDPDRVNNPKMRAVTMDDDCCMVTTTPDDMKQYTTIIEPLSSSSSSAAAVPSSSTIKESTSSPSSSTSTSPSNDRDTSIKDPGRSINIKLRICDTRPLLNASINKLAGKGYENINRLGGASSASCIFLGMDNIHVISKAYRDLRATCYARCNEFAVTPPHSAQGYDWLMHISEVLRGSVFIALQLHIGHPVVVHCSDGWDRTSIASAVAQLLLDPYYRTIHGFITLIYKDFIHFGHQCRARQDGMHHNHHHMPSLSSLSPSPSSLSYDASEISPIFIQFLDVVWQIWRQYPHEFEYDASLLIFIARRYEDGFIDDFKYNSFYDRIQSYYEHHMYDDDVFRHDHDGSYDIHHIFKHDVEVYDKLWGGVPCLHNIISTNTERFINPSYTSSSAAAAASAGPRHMKLLLPLWNILALELWHEIYTPQRFNTPLPSSTSSSLACGFLSKLSSKERDIVLSRESSRSGYLDKKICHILDMLQLYDEIQRRKYTYQRHTKTMHINDTDDVNDKHKKVDDDSRMPVSQDDWEMLDTQDQSQSQPSPPEIIIPIFT